MDALAVGLAVRLVDVRLVLARRRERIAVDVQGLDARGRRRERARGGRNGIAVDAELGLDARLGLAVLLAVQLLAVEGLLVLAVDLDARTPWRWASCSTCAVLLAAE